MEKLLSSKNLDSDRISRFLYGKKNHLSLKKRIFISAILITLVTAFLSLIWNIYLNLPFILSCTLVVAVITFGVFFYLARFKNSNHPIVFSIVSLALLSFIYFLNGGLHGSIPAIFIVYVAVTLSILEPKYHYYLLLITVVDLSALIVAEKYLEIDFLLSYNNQNIKELDLFFGYFGSIFACFFIVSIYKKTITDQNKELQSINDNKDLLFNIIAHDLRAPVNNILSLSKLMKAETANDNGAEVDTYSELIKNESVKVSKLLESLLAWGKIKNDDSQVKSRRVNVHDAAIEIIEFCNDAWSKKNIEIKLNIPKNLEVWSNPDFMNTIIRNLVSNAIKFTPNAGTVTIATEDLDTKRINILVKDTGIGMSQELIKNLFNLKYKTNRVGTNGESSNGLGLFITRELIEKQGGELYIESSKNRGSTFKFCLPKARLSIKEIFKKRLRYNIMEKANHDRT